MSTHAPGPWIALPEAFLHQTRIMNENRETVAVVPVWTDGTENEHIIEAAPDMLKALQTIERIVLDDYTIEETINGKAILLQIRNAVAAAEGRG